jgi:DNA mismatch repair protein MutS
MTMDASAGPHDEMFAYKVKPGQFGRSSGLQVAECAGMPDVVLRRAAELLARHIGQT